MLKEIIDQSGKFQSAWARRLGISEAHLSSILSHKRKPSLLIAARIERITGGAILATSFVQDEVDAWVKRAEGHDPGTFDLCSEDPATSAALPQENEVSHA